MTVVGGVTAHHRERCKGREKRARVNKNNILMDNEGCGLEAEVMEGAL